MSPHGAVKATATQRVSCADQVAELAKGCTELRLQIQCTCTVLTAVKVAHSHSKAPCPANSSPRRALAPSAPAAAAAGLLPRGAPLASKLTMGTSGTLEASSPAERRLVMQAVTLMITAAW